MRIELLTISRFRGIQSMEWRPSAGINCLIGTGNSCKSTIIDAISLLFTPRRGITLTDADYYQCVVTSGFSVEAVVTELPPELQNFEAYGDLQCGWDATSSTIEPDPVDELEPALVLRFRGDENLEAIWEVAKPGSDGIERPLRAGTRSRLGVFRVEDRPDYHLRWSRGSALAALSADDESVGKALTDAHRLARSAVFDADLDALQSASELVGIEATKLGAAKFHEPRPGLDPAAMSSSGALLLHDGDVPITAEGLGVKRLTSIAIQRLRADDHSIFIVDEVENGLEPHRLLRVVRLLRDGADSGRQTFLTTHSPTVVAASAATDLIVVRSNNGLVNASRVPAALEGLKSSEPQGTVRSDPGAMLARAVMVVEGATEEGLLRACTADWDSAEASLAILGVAVRVGGSDEQALERATCLATLGYRAAALLDFDKPLSEAVKDAESAGVTVLRCPEGLDLEHHIVRDLPTTLLDSFFDLAVSVAAEIADEDVARSALLDQMRSRMPAESATLSPNIAGWLDAGCVEDDVRAALGDSASTKKWFKTQRAGERLGLFVLEHASVIHEQEGELNFVNGLEKVKAFLYATEQVDDAPPA